MKVIDPKGPQVSDLVAFKLDGLDSLGEVSGGSWGQNGLVVVMDTGALVECGGLPDGGAWACHQIGPKLPSFGPPLKAAVGARMGTEQFRAAVTLDDEEEGTLLLLETVADGSGWVPVGEVGMPAGRGQMHLSLSPSADSVFVSANTGEVLKWALGSAEPTEQVS